MCVQSSPVWCLLLWVAERTPTNHQHVNRHNRRKRWLATLAAVHLEAATLIGGVLYTCAFPHPHPPTPPPTMSHSTTASSSSTALIHPPNDTAGYDDHDDHDDHDGENASPFIRKTYQLVSEAPPGPTATVQWDDTGLFFIVRNQNDFTQVSVLSATLLALSATLPHTALSPSAVARRALDFTRC